MSGKQVFATLDLLYREWSLLTKVRTAREVELAWAMNEMIDLIRDEPVAGSGDAARLGEQTLRKLGMLRES